MRSPTSPLDRRKEIGEDTLCPTHLTVLVKKEDLHPFSVSFVTDGPWRSSKQRMRCPLAALCLLLAHPLFPQTTPDNLGRARDPTESSTADTRILGVIPNYQTVSNSQHSVSPLSVKQKFGLFAKETFDPFIIVSSAAGAALSQADNDHPQYGQGSGPYAERFGAAVADVTTQNFFSDAVLASLLHED